MPWDGSFRECFVSWNFPTDDPTFAVGWCEHFTLYSALACLLCVVDGHDFGEDLYYTQNGDCPRLVKLV